MYFTLTTLHWKETVSKLFVNNKEKKNEKVLTDPC